MRVALLTALESKHNRPKAVPTEPPKPPVWPPGGPVWRFPPRVGERPAPARSGAGLGHTGPSLAERKENSPTRKTTASVTGEYASFRLSHQANGFPKTSSGERCVKQAGERPGVAGASPAGSPRPAEPVVPSFFPGVNFPVFRGRFWGLGVTDGVRKAKFPGGKPFSRVSPPGSTKG